ncbi:MAG: hypothetical protein HY928_02905 [Elusimicrobia bacterium]|nr:hypothetical protein [Elusimicrobiota bacterium]
MRTKTIIAAASACALAACSRGGTPSGGRVLEYGALAVAGSADPNLVGSMYDADLVGLLYDTLYEYEYLARPFKLKPALAAAMPEVSKDGRTYTIKLKPGIFYPDDACFKATGGKGREFEAKDFVHALYRKADPKMKSNTWWLVGGMIEGLDGLRKAAADKPFDYAAEIPDLKAVDRHTVSFRLKTPFPQILWVLAKESMAPHPLECAQFYGEDFANHPVGLGPFRMVEWQKNARYTLVRNEKYREDAYPSEGEEDDKAAGRLADAGKRLPFADKVIVHEFSQTQPYWLQFRAGKFAWGRVPGEFTEEVFKVASKDGNKKVWERDAKGRRVLSDEYAKKYAYYPLFLLDLIYRGFNYEDPVVGGDGKGKKVRQALALAHDIDAENDLFYNGLNVVYAGIVPPGVQGFDPKVKNPYKGQDLERARKLLAEAGYPEGKGLPELQECGSEDARSVEQASFFIKNAEKIGVKINYEAMRFAELTKKLKEKRCQIMGLAWGGDWPDAQNFVQLAYGPNKSPGSNNYNYDKPEVNRLYEQSLPMPPSPARDAIYQKINRIILEDQPFHGSMARTRDYLIPADTLNFKPEEMIPNHAKYVRLRGWPEAK